MALSQKLISLLELRHNVKFTDQQIDFLNIVYSKRRRQRLPLPAFAWAVYMALDLYPAPGQRPLFVHPPISEYHKLVSLEDFTD